MSLRICPDEFLQQVRPVLAEGDPVALARCVEQRWNQQQLCALLSSPRDAARRVAALVLGLVGDACCVQPLVRALHDADAQVNEMAEHGLWSIWFRSCSAEAAEPFEAGVTLLSNERYEQALRAFDQALSCDPDFAEGYNQRSIAYLLNGQWQRALADAERAVTHMPPHFGAVAAMGHCHMHLEQPERALEYYQQALAIQPRMPAIERAARRLEKRLHGAGPTEYAATGPLDDR